MKRSSVLSSNMRNTNDLNINPYTYECIDFDNLYALGPLAGDTLIRFLQGGALACAASLFKKYRQALSINGLSLTVESRSNAIV